MDESKLREAFGKIREEMQFLRREIEELKSKQQVKNISQENFSNVPDRINLNMLSSREKGILAVFTRNKGVPLTYQDIAKQTGKSPHTIKYQIMVMKLKFPNLFTENIETTRRTLLIKPGIHIESLF